MTIPAIDYFEGEYSFLSNFYKSPVEYMGVLYPTVEHAFQAAKTTADMDKRFECIHMTPAQAKRWGRKLPLRGDWEAVKIGIMTQIVSLKFEQNPLLAAKLAATYPRHLEEGNTWRDRFWGTYMGQGENHLGKILMYVRSRYVPLPEG